MKKLDMERRANEKLNELEEETRQKAQYLLAKAMEQRQDEEEEIKQLNAAITNAKIQTIRDAQVLEKQQIKKELAEENDRLDRMMEMDRQNALQVQAAIEAKRKEEVSSSPLFWKAYENIWWSKTKNLQNKINIKLILTIC